MGIALVYWFKVESYESDDYNDKDTNIIFVLLKIKDNLLKLIWVNTKHEKIQE